MKVHFNNNLDITINVGVVVLAYLVINQYSYEQYFLSDVVDLIFKINLFKVIVILIGAIILANLSKAKTKNIMQIVALFSLFVCAYHVLMTGF